jgi:hypothetical protein
MEFDDDASDSDPSTDAEDSADEEAETSHLDDLADGAGCTEIWEHLSDGRDE